ncbi:MAG: glycosyltransferase family 4 protein [Sphingomonas fennica]
MSADEPPPRRLRVLVLAAFCDPEGRQAALIGHALTQALANHADVHLVTATANAPALVRAGLREERDFTAIDIAWLTGWRDRIHRFLFGTDSERGWTVWQALTLPAYRQFERRVWRRFGKAIRAGDYDVVHRITPVTPALPSPIATRLARTGVPFVVGPLNGGLAWPAAFAGLRKAEGEWLAPLRGLARLLPDQRAMRRTAAAILIGSRDLMRRMPVADRDRAVYIPENGIDPARFPADAGAGRTPPGRPVRAIYLGRLVPYKGADMVIEAAASLLADGRMTLEIVGTGPMQDALAAQIADLGLGQAVTLAGDVDHRAVQAKLAAADILCAPAVREFGGAVVMEAMAMGVVPIVVDYGGPPEYVGSDCGFLLPLSDRAGLVARLRAVLAGIAEEPARLAPLSERGRQKAWALFTWDAKARMVLAIYRWVLAGGGADKPSFGMPLDRVPTA